MYKIRRKDSPELYIKGTPNYISQDKQGRIFPTLGSLRTFLTHVMKNQFNNKCISDWEIVEYVVEVKDVKGVHEVITPEKLIKLLTK